MLSGVSRSSQRYGIRTHGEAANGVDFGVENGSDSFSDCPQSISRERCLASVHVPVRDSSRAKGERPVRPQRVLGEVSNEGGPSIRTYWIRHRKNDTSADRMSGVFSSGRVRIRYPQP